MATTPTHSFPGQMPFESIDYNGKTIELSQLHGGHEYAIPGVFEGWRFANNRDQALEFAKEDVDSNGQSHAWRNRREGSAGWMHQLRQGIIKVE